MLVYIFSQWNLACNWAFNWKCSGWGKTPPRLMMHLIFHYLKSTVTHAYYIFHSLGSVISECQTNDIPD